MPSLNQLGAFTFVSFHRSEDPAAPPEILSLQTETIQRPGCDGTGIITHGSKANAFQMRSFVDCENLAVAESLSAQYKASVGDGPYGIIWGGINYTDLHNVVYVPLDVQITKLSRLGASAGGINWPSLARIEALWTLQPIANPAP